MNCALADTMMQELSEFLESQIGLRFTPDRWRDLERGMVSAAREFGFEDTESCARSLLSSPLTREQIELLSSHLTVGETYFFRERRSFEVLRDQVLPELINARRGSQQRIRIWSAGCCTGEEPYSLAMLLDQVVPGIGDWSITILATDINPRFLRKARDGVYNQWSFRGTPPGLVERYFQKTHGNHFEIIPRIREMVTFSYLNLAEDAYPSLLSNTNAMDLILCRNVLMYFSPERTVLVAERLHRSLVDGGWLTVGPSELSHVLFSQFTTVDCSGAILYRKDGAACRVVQGTLPPGHAFYTPVPDDDPEGSPPLGSGVRPEAAVTFSQEDRHPSGPQVTEPRTVDAQAAAYEDALALYEQGHYTEAEERLAAGLSQRQRGPGVLMLMARICANQGKLVKALGWCDKAISDDKLNPGAHYLRAAILQEQERDDEAAASLKRSLYIDQGFVLAHVALGHLATRQRRVKDAERHFGNAMSALKGYLPGEEMPEADGMTAERLREILEHHSLYSAENAEVGAR